MSPTPRRQFFHARLNGRSNRAPDAGGSPQRLPSDPGSTNTRRRFALLSLAATSQTVLVRGIGPALASFGVRDVLTDPRLEVFGAANVRLAENDNWTPPLAAIATQVGAFALPTGSRDARCSSRCHPGAYTAVLSGVGSTTGEAQIEIFEVP
jgi:hypothetical protein